MESNENYMTLLKGALSHRGTDSESLRGVGLVVGFRD